MESLRKSKSKFRIELSTSARIFLFIIVGFFIYKYFFACEKDKMEKFTEYNKKKYRDSYKIKQQKRDKYFDKFYYKI